MLKISTPTVKVLKFSRENTIQRPVKVETSQHCNKQHNNDGAKEFSALLEKPAAVIPDKDYLPRLEKRKPFCITDPKQIRAEINESIAQYGIVKSLDIYNTKLAALNAYRNTPLYDPLGKAEASEAIKHIDAEFTRQVANIKAKRRAKRLRNSFFMGMLAGAIRAFK